MASQRNSSVASHDLLKVLNRLMAGASGPLLPLGIFYEFPGFRTEAETHAVDPWVSHLLEALRQMLRKEFPHATAREIEKRLPITRHRKTTLNGMEMYERLATECIHYPYGRGEERNAEINKDTFAALIHDANLVELCIGDAHKTRLLLDAILKSQKYPAAIIANDLMPSNLAHARQLLKGHPFITVPGDINDATIWQNKTLAKQWKDAKEEVTLPEGNNLLEWLRNDKRRTVVLYQGVTFNNFTLKQMQQQLHFFHDAFKLGTIFFPSVDFTIDKKALERSYNNYYYRQLALMAAMYALKKNSIPHDPREWECRVDICQSPTGTEIQTVVVNAVSGIELPYEIIKKLLRDEWSEMVDRANLTPIEPEMQFGGNWLDGTDCAIVRLAHKTKRATRQLVPGG